MSRRQQAIARHLAEHANSRTSDMPLEESWRRSGVTKQGGVVYPYGFSISVDPERTVESHNRFKLAGGMKSMIVNYPDGLLKILERVVETAWADYWRGYTHKRHPDAAAFLQQLGVLRPDGSIDRHGYKLPVRPKRKPKQPRKPAVRQRAPHIEETAADGTRADAAEDV